MKFLVCLLLLLLPLPVLAVCTADGGACSVSASCCSLQCGVPGQSGICIQSPAQKNLFTTPVQIDARLQNPGYFNPPALQFMGITEGAGAIIHVNPQSTGTSFNDAHALEFQAQGYKILAFGGQAEGGGIQINTMVAPPSTPKYVWLKSFVPTTSWILTLPQTGATGVKVLASTVGSTGGVTDLEWTTAAALGAITGSGTANTLPKYTGTGTTLGNSAVTDDAANVNITGRFFNFVPQSSTKEFRLYESTSTAAVGFRYADLHTGTATYEYNIDPGIDGTPDYWVVADPDGTCKNNEVLTQVDTVGGMTCRPVGTVGGASCLPEIQADGSLGSSSICHNVGAPGDAYTFPGGTIGGIIPAVDEVGNLGDLTSYWSSVYAKNWNWPDSGAIWYYDASTLTNRQILSIVDGGGSGNPQISWTPTGGGSLFDFGTFTDVVFRDNAKFYGSTSGLTLLKATAVAGSTTLTLPAITDTIATITGNIATAAALAANPTDCSANQFANAIVASGNLTCAALVDADIPNDITINTTADAQFQGGNQAIKIGAGTFTSTTTRDRIRFPDTSTCAATDLHRICVDDSAFGCSNGVDMCLLFDPTNGRFDFEGTGSTLRIAGSTVPTVGTTNIWTGANQWTSSAQFRHDISYISNATTEEIDEDFQAAYTTGVYHTIKQTTGNPTAGTLLHVYTTDADPIPLKVTAQGTANGVQVSAAGVLAAIGTGLNVATADAHTGHIIYSDATAATHDTGTLVCAAVGYGACVTTYLPVGTNAACSNDYNTGVAVPFYAVCR